jgi:hypothetical protein
MAEATAKHELSEKEQADKDLADRLKRDGPSPLLVPAPETEVDKLRRLGTEVTDHNTAGLPAGGPANQPGMSAGGIPPDRDDIQKALDERAKERKKEESKEKHSNK